MGLIAGFLDKRADIYNLTTTSTTPSGQPVEELSALVKSIKVVQLKDKTFYDLNLPGNVLISDNQWASEKEVLLNQVMIIENDRFRVTRSRKLSKGKRIFAYILTTEFFQGG